MIIQNGKLLYHLTHIDNLDSIFTNGLLSRNNVQQLDGFVDVANHEILHSRHQHELDNYVLFHFHPYSAFDTAVKGNYEHPISSILLYRGNLQGKGNTKLFQDIL